MKNHWKTMKKVGDNLNNSIKSWKKGAGKAGSMVAKKTGEAVGFITKTMKSKPARMAICIGLGIIAGSAWQRKENGDLPDVDEECNKNCHSHGDWS